MSLPTDPDEATHQLAAARPGEPTAWFDDLYRAAGAGAAVVPWDRTDPQPAAGRVSRTRRPAHLGTDHRRRGGVRRHSEYLASLGYLTTAFDISRSAVEQTRARFPDSVVTYGVADLLALPRGGSGRSTSSWRA